MADISDPAPITLRPLPTLNPRADQLVWRLFIKTVLLIADARTSSYPPADQGRHHEGGQAETGATVPDTLPGPSTAPANATTTHSSSADPNVALHTSQPVEQKVVAEEKLAQPKPDKWVRVVISFQLFKNTPTPSDHGLLVQPRCPAHRHLQNHPFYLSSYFQHISNLTT